MGWSGNYGQKPISGWSPIMSDDPISSDPVLLYTWTRIVIALVAILAFAVGMDLDTSTILPNGA